MKRTVLGGLVIAACSAAWGSSISFTSVSVTVGSGQPGAVSSPGSNDAVIPSFVSPTWSAAGEFCVQGSCSVATPPLNVLGGLRLTNSFIDCGLAAPCGSFTIAFQASGQVTGPVNVLLLLDNINWDTGPELVQGTFSAGISVNGGPVQTLNLPFDNTNTSFGPTASILINNSGAIAINGSLTLNVPAFDFMGLPDSGIVEFTDASTPAGTPEPATAWIVLAAIGGLAVRRFTRLRVR